MGLERLFSCKDILFNKLNILISKGTTPINLLLLTSIFINCEACPISAGKFPENPFLCKYSPDKFLAFPVVGAISPSKELKLRSRIEICENSQIPLGILPFILFFFTQNATYCYSSIWFRDLACKFVIKNNNTLKLASTAQIWGKRASEHVPILYASNC